LAQVGPEQYAAHAVRHGRPAPVDPQ